MKWFISLSLLFFTSHVLGQNCDCSSQLRHVTRYFEENNPAFQKIKQNAGSYKAYSAKVRKLQRKAKREKDEDGCIIYLDRYVGLLKDHHSGIGFNLVRQDLSTPDLIATFKASDNYRGFKKIVIDTTSLIPILNSKQTADIEGVYSDGRNLVFGIISQGKKGSYVGVVLKQNKLLDVGHVLLELTAQPGGSYDITYYIGLLGFNFQKIFKNQFIENGQMPGLGFSKTTQGASGERTYEFKTLDDSTNYIRLNSFDGRLTAELDSFYAAVDKQIKSKPFLVIDVRNNGGGSERSYIGLLPYIYTHPLKIDSASVWVSPGNIKRYEESSGQHNPELINRMKAAPSFTYIPFSPDTKNTWTLDSSTFFPGKIALLFNRGTASAAEGLIVYGMQSDKVITIGENSGGYIGYGNVMSAPTPCKKFTIQSTTTRYYEKSKYEFVGIEPMFKVSAEQDWTRYARTLLGNEK